MNVPQVDALLSVRVTAGAGDRMSYLVYTSGSVCDRDAFDN